MNDLEWYGAGQEERERDLILKPTRLWLWMVMWDGEGRARISKISTQLRRRSKEKVVSCHVASSGPRFLASELVDASSLALASGGSCACVPDIIGSNHDVGGSPSFLFVVLCMTWVFIEFDSSSSFTFFSSFLSSCLLSLLLPCYISSFVHIRPSSTSFFYSSLHSFIQSVHSAFNLIHSKPTTTTTIAFIIPFVFHSPFLRFPAILVILQPSYCT